MSDPEYPSGDRYRLTGIAKGPFWLWLAASVVAGAAMVYLHLFAFRDHIAPIGFGLPLLLCLANRDLRLLYGMAVAFSLVLVLKASGMKLATTGGEPWFSWASLGMELVSTWVFAAVIHVVVVLRVRLENKARQYVLANAELEASNQELATREEEIAQQNQELQTQAQELEQQAEALRQQAQELEQQATELHTLNHELSRREKGLQTLLESARWLRSDVGEENLLAAICHAAIQVMEEGIVAAAVVCEQEGYLTIRGHQGFGIHPGHRTVCPFEHSFASLVIETKRTAYVHDLASRPDISYIQPPVGRPFGSVLATPVWVDGKVTSAVEVYSSHPRHWSAEEFRIIEWIAAQVALAMQALEYQANLEQRRREAELASIQKTQFLASVSHDVRTPVNAISLLADVIEQSARDPGFMTELPRLVRDLRSNARALVELVSDVLDLARMDAGKMELQTSAFSLNALLAAEVRQHLPVARAKGIALIADLPDSALWVRTDKMKLARVASNLIGNALKFTESGEVRVGLTRRADGSLEVCIVDTGVGIPKEQMARIFDEFYQIRNPERDRNKGSGLGLAICKRLTDRLGCAIAVESVPGKGSTFRVVVPQGMTTEPAEAAPTQPAPQSRPHLRGIRVLLVEDHDGTRRAAAQLLAAHGATVFQAPNGRTAIHMLVHEHPDVLLLDLMLPDMDGSEVLRQLDYHRPASLRCILAVSGDVRPEREAEVRRLGASGLVAKPLNIDDLLVNIQTHMAKAEMPEPGTADAPAAEGARSPVPIPA